MGNGTRRSAPTPLAAPRPGTPRKFPARRSPGSPAPPTPSAWRSMRAATRSSAPIPAKARRRRELEGNRDRPGHALTSVSCVAGPLCVAVDKAGDVLESSEPAGSWAPPRQIDSSPLARGFVRLRARRRVRGRGRNRRGAGEREPQRGSSRRLHRHLERDPARPDGQQHADGCLLRRGGALRAGRRQRGRLYRRQPHRGGPIVGIRPDRLPHGADRGLVRVRRAVRGR